MRLLAVESAVDLPRPLARHAAECLRCQAEIARSQRLSRMLAGAGETVYRAPDGLAESVESAIDRHPLPSGSRVRPATTVAAAAGALAAAAGTLVVIGWMRTRSAA